MEILFPRLSSGIETGGGAVIFILPMAGAGVAEQPHIKIECFCASADPHQGLLGAIAPCNNQQRRSAILSCETNF
jgi:hypothetical protein